MAVEQTAIIDAFKNEGLNEGIAEGLNFETDDAMKTWIGKYKEATSFNPESLDKFTPEQLMEMASKRQSKSMQSLVDKLKSDAQKKVQEEWNKSHPSPTKKPETGGGGSSEKSELEKQVAELLRKEEERDKKEQQREELASLSKKKSSIIESLKKDGCNNEDILEFVDLKIKITADSNVEDCIKEGKAIYDEKYKKLFGGKVYSPVGGGGPKPTDGKPSESIQKIKEKAQARIKKLSL